MRTIIRGGWVVAFNGNTHTLIRNGALVYEGNRIVHVGHSFDGPFDAEIDATGKLVAPGFIDIHVHAGDRAGHRLISDGGRPEYFGTPIPRRRRQTRLPWNCWCRGNRLRQRSWPRHALTSKRPLRWWSCFATASRHS